MRKGQEMFNFLEWLGAKGYDKIGSHRMADPFNIEDEKWDELWEEWKWKSMETK